MSTFELSAKFSVRPPEMGKFVVLLLLLLSLTISVKATNSNTSCYSEGLCPYTWTFPKSGKNTSDSIAHCKYQNSMTEFFDGVQCTDIDLPDGPHVTINIGLCMTFDKSTNITYLGKCPYNHIYNSKSSNFLLPWFIHELCAIAVLMEGVTYVVSRDERVCFVASVRVAWVWQFCSTPTSVLSVSGMAGCSILLLPFFQP